MDHRKLLEKYMDHIVQEEGCSFIPHFPNEHLSQVEIDELNRIFRGQPEAAPPAPAPEES